VCTYDSEGNRDGDDEGIQVLCRLAATMCCYHVCHCYT
jgi:hypothetical protein